VTNAPDPPYSPIDDNRLGVHRQLNTMHGGRADGCPRSHAGAPWDPSGPTRVRYRRLAEEEQVPTEKDSRGAALARRARPIVPFGRHRAVFLGLLAGRLLARIAVTPVYHPTILFNESLAHLQNPRRLVAPQVRPPAC
jgi:hypothetical protein